MTYKEFIKQINIKLNEQQEAAVKRVEGPTLLLAVPGSGKTTVIVTRLGYMVYCRGIDPQSILTMTYTVSATNDMRERYREKFGNEYADKLEFRTINGVCDKIIRYYEKIRNTKAFRLVGCDGESSRIIRTLWLTLGLDYPTDSDIKEVKTLITYVKNMQMGDSEIKNIKSENCSFFAVYDAYRTYMRENGLMDFDDQLVYAYKILLRNPDILAHFQNRCTYINVDEAQDTSKIQHAVIHCLACGHSNLFMVGDEDQSIYGFRAAYPQALLDFEKSWHDAKVLLMETNYRSSGTIVSRANEFIKRNHSRHDKNMRTLNPVGVPIKHTVLKDLRDQYSYLTAIAKFCTVQTAVLYRNNDSAIPLIDLLIHDGTPYRSRQLEGSFFTHYIVRDIRDIISLAFDPYDADAFEHVYYKLGLGISKAIVSDAMSRHAANPRKTIIDTVIADTSLYPAAVIRLRTLAENLYSMKSDTSYEALTRITSLMGYNDYLRSRHSDTTRLDILMALAVQNPSLMSFSEHLDALSEVVNSGTSAQKSNFILSTIHSSKGLEYERVILIDVVDGLFPSIAEPEEDKSLKDAELMQLEEERRLFYVGVTRAKREVEIITYDNRYGLPAQPVSTFITHLLPPQPKPAGTATKKTTLEPVVSYKQKNKSKTPDIDKLSEAYVADTRVIHKTFGAGVILMKNLNVIVISFDSGEVKKFDLPSCVRKKFISLET